jgi:DNA polymerase III delta subunit
MIQVLLGSDIFSKRRHIAKLAETSKLEVAWFPEDGDVSQVFSFVAPSLFGGAKVFVLRNLFGKLSEKDLEKLRDSKEQIVLLEDKLDKRKSQAQKFLKDKQVKVTEFTTPTGPELEKWITARTKELGSKISPKLAAFLASRFFQNGGGSFKFTEPVFDLWQVDNEIQKLLAYTKGGEITEAAALALTPDLNEADSWDIVNAMAEKDVKKVFALTENFFSGKISDEKAKAILLNAILADQFRNILLVQAAASSRLSDAELLSRTGWKSGRLFVLKKLAAKFDPIKVRDFCKKLVSLDEQLKSSSVPPRVLLDLISSQIIY